MPNTTLNATSHSRPTLERPRYRPWMGDLLVYVALAGLTYLAWWVSAQGYFSAGDDWGYWIGVAGGVLMLLLFLYPLRKRFRFTQKWGKVKWWFWFHMLLGVGGPWLILVHSTFRVGSLNAGVALYSMLIVAGSGVIGRFLYRHVNRGLRGEEIALHELKQYAGMHKASAEAKLAFAPEVAERLHAFEAAELRSKPGWPTYFRQAMVLPLKRELTYLACRRDLDKVFHSLVLPTGKARSLAKRERKQQRKLVRTYLHAVVGVAQFSAFERLFALWHLAHLPFVYLLIISAIVHIVAVHAY
jgi:hypothetical protein